MFLVHILVFTIKYILNPILVSVDSLIWHILSNRAFEYTLIVWPVWHPLYLTYLHTIFELLKIGYMILEYYFVLVLTTIKSHVQLAVILYIYICEAFKLSRWKLVCKLVNIIHYSHISILILVLALHRCILVDCTSIRTTTIPGNGANLVTILELQIVLIFTLKHDCVLE